MTRPADAITRFYLDHLKGSWNDGDVYLADCPFCRTKKVKPAGKMAVILNPDGYFHGYFRCLTRCVPGGFPIWFASLSGLDASLVPGYDPDREEQLPLIDFPLANHNDDMRSYHDRLPRELEEHFQAVGIGKDILHDLQVGFNGRYISYPYLQADGNCYSLRCVFPDRPEDFFWHGDEQFARDPFRLFNVEAIKRCAGGTLFICEGEDNLLTLLQLGYPGIGVPLRAVFETLESEVFADIDTIFLVPANSSESEAAARAFATRVGYKVRIFRWPAGSSKNMNLTQLARENGSGFRAAVSKMITAAKAFSPFASTQKEYLQCQQRLAGRQDEAYNRMQTGFTALDQTLEGFHGINVVGGAPKVGKSAFAIQAAGQMAEQGIPVLYYDFENGRQKIYQRVLARISRLQVARLGHPELSSEEQTRYEKASSRLQKMMHYLRVINDRKITPELMRRHIDFIRHETRSEYVSVIVDSLHKLPFKEFSEQRTGIDAWLRQFESIRDQLQVSFLVLSELNRGEQKAYTDEPHLGIYKGSGDIEYSADNAMVLTASAAAAADRRLSLWVVASREHSPGLVSDYTLDYPYWGFVETPTVS